MLFQQVLRRPSRDDASCHGVRLLLEQVADRTHETGRLRTVALLHEVRRLMGGSEHIGGLPKRDLSAKGIGLRAQ